MSARVRKTRPPKPKPRKSRRKPPQQPQKARRSFWGDPPDRIPQRVHTLLLKHRLLKRDGEGYAYPRVVLHMVPVDPDKVHITMDVIRACDALELQPGDLFVCVSYCGFTVWNDDAWSWLASSRVRAVGYSWRQLARVFPLAYIDGWRHENEVQDD